MHKKMLRLLSIILICFAISGCSDKDAKEISDTITVNAGVQYNNTFHKTAAEQYQTAIINGNIEWMKEIVAANPELDVNYTNEMTAMYCACWESNDRDYYKAKTIEALLEVGVDPNIGDPLQLSTYNKKYYYTEALLNSDKTKLDTTDLFDNTPLSMAMQNNSGGCSIYGYEQVLLMLEAGATPYPEMFRDDNEGHKIGSHFANVDLSPVSTKLLMNMLLESGQSSGLKPALEYAFSGQIDKCVEELQKCKDEDYNSDEKYVMSLYAAYFGTPELYEEAQKYLKGSVYTDIISRVAETGNYDMVKYLLEKYDFDITSEDADTFLLESIEYAARWGRADICQLLCDNNIRIKRWYSGYSVFGDAVFSEDLETVKVIYNYIKEKDEVTEADLSNAYQWYSLKDKENAKKVVDFFFDEGYNLSCVEFSYIDKEFAEYLYEKGRPLAPSDLTYAVKSEDPEFVKLVLEKGADPNQDAYWADFGEIWYINDIGDVLDYNSYLTDEFTESRTSIMNLAIGEANSQIVQLLIDYGADVLCEDYIVNCRYSSKATAKVLIESGANLDIIIEDRPRPISIGALDYKFTLPEYFERHGRKDLSDLVKEYQ